MDRRAATEEAADTAAQFYKLFYDTMEGRRHLISRLYMDQAVMIWNGHGVCRVDNIQKFYDELPPATFNIISYDSHPIIPELSRVPPKTLCVNVGGILRAPDQPSQMFSECFVLTAQEDKWKIASDTFRSFLPPTC